MISNPPRHGGVVAARVLGDDSLRPHWETELAEMRDQLVRKRRLLADHLANHPELGDYSFLTNQRGMFSCLGMNDEQVKRIREEFSVYLVGNGRINVAGVNDANIEYVADALATVL